MDESKSMTKSVALVIASKDFQPIEYGKTKDVLKKHGITVITVSDQAGTATATDGSTVSVDKTVKDAHAADYAGIFLIGGAGALDHLDISAVHALMKDASQAGKIWGAICISPRILAHAGLLKGRTITGWDGDKKLDDVCAKYEVNRSAKSVEVDGTLITADGPSSATAFGEVIVTALK